MDTVLLAALNSNNTQLVLSFAHLAVGGAYLPGTNQSTLLTTITLHSGGEGVEVEVGGEEGEGDVQVMVEGAANGSIQVCVSVCIPTCSVRGTSVNGRPILEIQYRQAPFAEAHCTINHLGM